MIIYWKGESMRKIKWGQLAVMVIILALSSVSIYQSVYLKKNPVRYGLDLRGGVHLVLVAEPILDTAEAETETTAPGEEAEVQETQENTEATSPETTSETPQEEKPLVVTNEDLQPEKPDDGKISAKEMEQTKSVIEKRVNALGVSETIVNIEGNNRIIVDIPGFTDINQAKNVIGRIAVLTFKDEAGEIIVTGKNLKQAMFQFQATKEGGVREPVVLLEWDQEGKILFAEGTERNVDKTISIFLDDQLLIAPKVNEPIRDGNAVITFGGKESTKEAQEVAALLQGGSLPLKLEFLEERVIGPTLGRDTIDNSQTGALIAILAVMLLMLVLYRFLGIIGVAALFFYVVIYFGFLVFINATFSLPAIGAAILSVGMAVDSNVIVFERIKEEHAKGRTIRSAVAAGYRYGLTAIVDSNLAMVLAMFILYSFGTVQVKGFAVTLIAGIIAALVTSLFFTRFILETFATDLDKMKKNILGV